MNVHMKNTINKYKLNFKTMKKGLLTVLAASLVFVGCQNYDDQFDDLNAQISALKSQVDGLSSLSGQVASLSGTISGLQAGVSAAQASAAAANTAASAIDLSGLSASLAELETKVNAVQASLAGTATASAVTTLQAEIDAIEADLDDLLASSNIYSTDVTVNNATTLNSALALGNKLNVLNATLTVTGYSGMDYTKVQTLMDRINTMTGNLVYSAYSSTGTPIVWNNLTSAGNITVTQPGSISFPKLTNAAEIDMRDDYETTVTTISFPLLTSATSIETDTSSGDFEVIFTYATSVDFGSLVTAPSNTVTITTKKDATLDLGKWLSQDASGNKTTATVTLNGPASWTNGTAAGTFASTGLPGNTAGAHDGTISLTNVATAAIHNFRGAITLNTGVKNFTGNNIVTVTHSGATDLESFNSTFMRDNDPGLSATAIAAFEKETNTAQDVSFGASHTKLTSVTVTGTGGDVTVSAAPAVTTVNLTGLTAMDVDMSGNVAMTSFTDATNANDWTFDNNDLMTSVNSSHTTKLYGTDKAAALSVVGNAEITSLTIASDDIDDLDITTNAKLATLAASGLTDNGTSTTAPVDIYDNAFVASLVRDSMESDATRAATGWAVGGATDTGAITTTSGLPTLDTYLTDALATASNQSVWFDTVTKLEIQATYGGAYTDTTSSLPTSAPARTGATATDFSSAYSGYLVYLFNIDAVAAVTRTVGAISTQKVSYAYDIVRNATTQAETRTLAANEGVEVWEGTSSIGTFKDGAAYTGAANGSTVETLDDLIAFINADTTLDNGYSYDLTAAEDGFNKAMYTITYRLSTGATAAAGNVSTGGFVNFTFGNYNSGASMDLQGAVTATNTEDGIATGVIAAINAAGDYTAAATGGNGNQFYVSKHVSDASGIDYSPLVTSSTWPTLTFVLGSDSTTAALVGTGRGSVSLGSSVAYNYDTATASEANASGLGSEFTLTTAKSHIDGLRITITNNSGISPANNLGVAVLAASNTVIKAATSNAGGSLTLTQGLIVAGTNIASYVANTGTVDNMEAPATYVAAFSDIASGSSATVSAATTGYSTNRTGW